MLSVNAKACGACAKAKRRCGRQLPACERCVRQKLDCAYPSPHTRQSVQPSRPSDYRSPAGSSSTPEQLLLQSNGISELYHRFLDSAAARAVPSPASTPSTRPIPPSGDTIYNVASSPSFADAQSAWFLGPETWEIVRLNTIPNRPIRSGVTEEFVSTLNAWLGDWLRTGRNAFIHKELYTSRVPASIGDAFTALASYFHRTPATEPMVFRILEDRITALVANATREPSDVLGRISRVQALTAYSTICLFHGDIRLRRVAEVNLPHLVSWCSEMLQTTARAANSGQLLYAEMVNALAFLGTDDSANTLPPQDEMDAAWQHLGVAEQEMALWHTWVVAESVRRAWLTARGVETIYLALRDRSAACHGGLAFTMNKSIWEADTAFAWAKACAQSDPGFMHIFDTEKLCSQPTSDAMDEFAKVMIKMNFRTDRTSSWVRGGCDG